jgi:hypothetical protein
LTAPPVTAADLAVLLAAFSPVGADHRSRGVGPADYFDAEDLGRLLGDAFTIELHAAGPRIDPPPDIPHIADVVLRAQRR